MNTGGYKMKKVLMLVLALGIAQLCLGQGIGVAAKVIPPELLNLMQQADSAHEAKDYDLTMELLQQALELDKMNDEILWKISRGYFDFADRKPNDLEYKKPFLYKGREFADRALAINDKSAGGHKWYAIHHGQVGEAEGTEQKIKNSYGMRDHTMLAIKYDPEDDANYHVMGRWHYALADLSWFERKIAGMIYAKPPEASFEEALEFFKKAHSLDSKDIRNMLYIGYCHDQLGNEEMAADWFEKALDAEAETDSDRALQAEAKEALADL
jgi:tetratricopeptide (TPR) repeat protein